MWLKQWRAVDKTIEYNYCIIETDTIFEFLWKWQTDFLLIIFNVLKETGEKKLESMPYFTFFLKIKETIYCQFSRNIVLSNTNKTKAFGLNLKYSSLVVNNHQWLWMQPKSSDAQHLVYV